VQLLMRMAHNKLLEQMRQQHTQARDMGRLSHTRAEEHPLLAPDASPSRFVAARDLLDEVDRRLAEDERQVVQLRREGLEWPDIGARLNASPEALRKKVKRALDRVARELGQDEVVHE
jgi:DNA-directed RNA polymerase specialized sigma24 family protein